jgi:hypothetical protein
MCGFPEHDYLNVVCCAGKHQRLLGEINLNKKLCTVVCVTSISEMLLSSTVSRGVVACSDRNGPFHTSVRDAERERERKIK